jgi:putative DNA primase/helicase
MGRVTLAPIVQALGGDLLAGGRRANVPGPGHSPEDRSDSLWLVGGRVVIHCFAGDDWREVLADLRQRGLVDGDGRLDGVGSPAPSHDDGLSRAARIRAAQALWDARGALAGVELTYLAPDGDRARMGTPRKTIGTCPAGAAVRLARAEPRMLVGEGVFTCLSASAVFGLPAWALLSARNLRAWRPPNGVRFVLVAGDRGREGEASAWALAETLRRLSLACEVALPPAPFGDWNEAVVGGAEGGGGGRA